MKGSIKLSQKHGVNPTVMKCPICFADTGVALMGKLKGDEQAPRAIKDQEPCRTCSGHMTLGFLFVESYESGGDLITTGNRWVVTHESAIRMLGEERTKSGVARIMPEDAKALGFYDVPPTEGIDA